MERYKLLSEKIKDKTTQKERYSSTFYPIIPYRDTDVYIYSRSSDRLDLLAYDFYKDQRYWWVIARANNLGKGSFMIPPGIRLRIPYPINELELERFIEDGLT